MQESDRAAPAVHQVADAGKLADPAGTGSPAGGQSLSERLAARIREHGPVPASEFIEAALYDPDDGFYATRGGPGQRGDFLTAPEIGPLFGAVLVRALQAWKQTGAGSDGLPESDETGESDGGSEDRFTSRAAPDERLGASGQDAIGLNRVEGREDGGSAQGARRFHVVELGAGAGSLARAVLAASGAAAAGKPDAKDTPDHEETSAQSASGTRSATGAADGLCWWAVEPSDRLRDLHPDDPGIRSVASLDDVEAVPEAVLANELLDNVPFGVIERAGDGWREVLVGIDSHGRFVETPGPLVAPPTAGSQPAEQAAAAAASGARLPVHDRAVALLRDLRVRFPRARIVAFDYAASTAELLQRSGDWLRCYADHARLDDWLSDPGSRDITCDLAIEQITAALDDPPIVMSQADWLRGSGIDDLVAEGRTVWAQRSAIGDLAAMRARSRVHEAEALTDPCGLGGFSVFEWKPMGGAGAPHRDSPDRDSQAETR